MKSPAPAGNPAIRRLLASFSGQPVSMLALTEVEAAITAILGKYEKLSLQLADVSLAHLANREGIEVIFTLDRRDFSMMRLARGKRLRLIP